MHSILGNTVMVFSVKHNEELKIEEIEEAYFLQCSKSSFPEHNKSDKEGDLSCTIIKEEKLADQIKDKISISSEWKMQTMRINENMECTLTSFTRLFYWRHDSKLLTLIC